MFIVDLIHGLLGVHLAQSGQRTDHAHIGPYGKMLAQAHQEGILRETQGCWSCEVCAQLAHICEVRLIYLTDVRNDQNISVTDAQLTVAQELSLPAEAPGRNTAADERRGSRRVCCAYGTPARPAAGLTDSRRSRDGEDARSRHLKPPR